MSVVGARDTQPTPSSAVNLHATAIVIGDVGLLFTGASGSGKSAAAFACMVDARRRNLFSALVADDQIFVDRRGEALFAMRPATIAGLMELRGSGIATLPSVAETPLHLAVRMVDLPGDERLPPDGEVFDLADLGQLPLVRLARQMPEPLAVLSLLHPALGAFSPFRS